MKKSDRDKVYNKFGGKCAYTGKPLDDKWQVDHMTPLVEYKFGRRQDDPNDINNLMPAMRIINHYKRSHSLESFRRSMLKFHKRLAKLPKKTRVERTEKRKIYMYKVAELFEITVDKPFSGKFYFETLQDN